MLWKLIDRRYKKGELYEGISKAFDRNKKNRIKQNEPKYRIPFTLTYNRYLPNPKEAVKKFWKILKINNKFKDVFPEPPILCFARHKNLKEFLWMKTLAYNKAQNVKFSYKKAYTVTCLTKTGNLSCKQVKHKNIVSSTATKRTYNIYNKLNCKCSWFIKWNAHCASDNIPLSQKQHSKVGE